MKLYSLVVILVIAAACSDARAPDRPRTVPSTAVWAGGVDGGAWIDCAPAAKEPHFEYQCTVYEESGPVWATGAFILGERRDGDYVYPGGAFMPPRIRSYHAYDGVLILIDDVQSLVPREWIDYPSGDGHGKRVRYKGIQAIEELSY